jgi:hypothetical protein
MREEVIPLKDKKVKKCIRNSFSPVTKRIWLRSIEWQCRKDRILFYWGLVLLSVLAGFSAEVVVYDSEVHVRTMAGLTIWYLVRRVIRCIAAPK